MSLFEDAASQLTDALAGDFRRQVVEQFAAGADFRASLTRLRDAMRAHTFKLGKKRVDFGPVVRALDHQTRADGFHVLHDWNGPAKCVNDDMIVVDVLHYVIEKGGHEQSDPATLAILLDYYFTYVTGLLALRAWDDGDANANLDRVDDLINAIQGPNGSGQRFVDDAATLTVIVTAHYEPDDPAYDRLLTKVQSLDATHRARSGIVHAATMGNHLRFGMAATYGGSLSGMREDNTVDYPWLCFALASTMAEYARLIDSGASEDARAPYVEAILGGLSPDAQAFLTEPVTALRGAPGRSGAACRAVSRASRGISRRRGTPSPDRRALHAIRFDVQLLAQRPEGTRRRLAVVGRSRRARIQRSPDRPAARAARRTSAGRRSRRL